MKRVQLKNEYVDVLINLYLVSYFILNATREEVLLHFFSLELGLNFTAAILLVFLSVHKLSAHKRLAFIGSILLVSLVVAPFYFQFISSEADYVSLATGLTFVGVVTSKIRAYARHGGEAAVWGLFNLFVGMALLMPAFLVGAFYLFSVWGSLYFGGFQMYMLWAAAKGLWPYSIKEKGLPT